MRRILPAAVLATLLPLAACSNEPADPPTVTVTQTTVVEEPTGPENTASDNAAPESTASESATPPAQQTQDNADACAQLPKDPREAYPSGTAPGRMPADDGSDFNYWIEDIDNAYDPCAPLSWIIFRGSLGDEHRPAGTGASIADGLALYVNGAPAQDMAAVDKIESVVPTPDGGVDLAWGERTGATAEGITAHYTVHLLNDGGAVVPVSGSIDEFNRWWNYPVHYLLGTYD
ncbi:hypothetical protein [Corynebacterium hadale]|uniref:hypothetical protein n=1 Tax=Corynebacterium hadale TaxID=2026255 RepID=UPI00105618FC|nr:hypothetical protein [Corynebacterium hadale]